jgi:hypothetical protein
MSILRQLADVHETECDVCHDSTIVGTHDDDTDRVFLEAHGWRWRPSPPGPLDTCPACLQAGR